MANFVIKKDGTKEAFDAEKIKRSITVAAQKTDLSEEQVNKAVERAFSAAIQLAEGKEEITTAELRGKILTELDIIEPSISEEWRKYDQEKGKV